jgi:hypothetical protein
MIDVLKQRFDLLVSRLQTSYDGIGHSSGRPFLYFVYHPADEPRVQKLAYEYFRDQATLTFCQIDILQTAIASLRNQEERRMQFLNDPTRRASSTEAILKLWARRLCLEIEAAQGRIDDGKRPVVVLRNLAALYPLSNPSALLEFLAEQEPRCLSTGKIVPIVLMVPGSRPPQTSRLYWFLDQERLKCDFYRGEEI